MANITLNTSDVGTFNLEYKAVDESGNISTNKRNVFILPTEGEANLQLVGSQFVGLNASSFSATTINYLIGVASGDPGVTATDQYGNDVSGYVKVEHFKHFNGASTGVKIYDSTDTGNYSTPITNNNDPSDMWIFDRISEPPPRDPPLEPSDLNLSSTQLTSWGLANYKTYYKVKYTLSIVSPAKEIYRTVHIRDLTAPVFSFNSISNYVVPEGDPQGIVATNETNAKEKYNYQENYWFISGKLPTNAGSGDAQDDDRIGFTVENVTYVHEDGTGTTDSSLIPGTDGVWTAYHRFKCSFKNSSNKVINYLPDSDPSNYENVNKLYEITRTITVNTDNVKPVIEFLPIDITYGTDGTIKTSSGGGSDSNSSSDYGTITIKVPTEIGNNTDDLSIAAALGDNNDNFKNDTDQSWAEIKVTDNTDSSPTISYTITQQTLNFSSPQDVENVIRRTHIGKDFSSLFDSYTIKPKIAGTTDSPAIFIITYTAKDNDDNTQTVTRTLKVIDPTSPTIEFNPNAITKYGTGITFQKNAGSGNQQVVQSNFKTTADDNFGDSETLTIVNDVFRAAYPKNVLNNIFKIKYSSSTGYIIYDLYDVELSGEQALYKKAASGGTKYYFDLSDTTLSGDSGKIYRFFPKNDNDVATLASHVDNNVSYTPISTYNAYMEIDALNISNGIEVVIKKADSESDTFSALTFQNSVTFKVSNA